MKGFTDLDQSRKLAEFLPIKSADMGWNVFVDNTTRILPIDDWDLSKNSGGNLKFYPAWSLAALLAVLPSNKNVVTTVSRGGWQMEPIDYLPNVWFCEYEDDENLTGFNVSADNPVDACYEMILKLHEQNLL